MFLLYNGCRVNGFETIFMFGLRLYKVLIVVILVLEFFVFIQFRSDFSVTYLLYPRFKALLPTLKLYPDIGSLRLVFRGTFLRTIGLSTRGSNFVQLLFKSSGYPLSVPGMILSFGLLYKVIFTFFGRRPISRGNDTNLLSTKSRYSSFVRLPIDDGIDFKSLSPNSRCTRFIRLPIDDGNLVNLLSHT